MSFVKAAARPQRLLLNTLANIGGTVFTLAVLFFLTPFVLHRLGATDYGLWVLASAIVGYGMLLDLGIGAAVTRSVAHYRTSEGVEAINAVVATALVAFTVLGAVVVAVSLALAAVVPHVFNVPSDREGAASAVVVLTGVGVAVALAGSVPLAVLRGAQRFDLVNTVSAVGMLVYAAATVAVLSAGGGVVALAALSAPLELAVQVPMIVLSRRAVAGLRFDPRRASRSRGREIASFGSAQFLIRTSTQIRTKSDEIVIGAFLPIGAIAPYAVARRVSQLPMLVSSQFSSVVMPLAAELDAAHDRETLRRAVVATTRTGLAIFLALGVGVAVLAGPFLGAWVGSAYARDSHLVLLLMGAGLLDIAAGPGATILIGTARHRRLAAYTVVAMVINVGLSVALVRPLGVEGVAVAALAASAVQALGLVLPYVLRAHELRASALVRHAVVPAAVAAVPAAAVAFALRAALDPRALAPVVAVIAASFAVYVGTYALLPATAFERSLLVDLLRRRRAAAPAETIRQGPDHLPTE